MTPKGAVGSNPTLSAINKEEGIRSRKGSYVVKKSGGLLNSEMSAAAMAQQRRQMRSICVNPTLSAIEENNSLAWRSTQEAEEDGLLNR